MVLYKSSQTAAEQMAQGTPEQREEAMKLWGAWMQKVGDALVDVGAPLAENRTLPAGSLRGDGGHIGGYSILQGDSDADVANILENHPHFHSPNATIEVLELLPVPGMGG